MCAMIYILIVKWLLLPNTLNNLKTVTHPVVTEELNVRTACAKLVLKMLGSGQKAYLVWTCELLEYEKIVLDLLDNYYLTG